VFDQHPLRSRNRRTRSTGAFLDQRHLPRRFLYLESAASTEINPPRPPGRAARPGPHVMRFRPRSAASLLLTAGPGEGSRAQPRLEADPRASGSGSRRPRSSRFQLTTTPPVRFTKRSPGGLYPPGRRKQVRGAGELLGIPEEGWTSTFHGPPRCARRRAHPERKACSGQRRRSPPTPRRACTAKVGPARVKSERGEKRLHRGG